MYIKNIYIFIHIQIYRKFSKSIYFITCDILHFIISISLHLYFFLSLFFRAHLLRSRVCFAMKAGMGMPPAANKATVPFRIIGLMHYCSLSSPTESSDRPVRWYALVAGIRIHFNALLRIYALTSSITASFITERALTLYAGILCMPHNPFNLLDCRLFHAFLNCFLCI